MIKLPAMNVKLISVLRIKKFISCVEHIRTTSAARWCYEVGIKSCLLLRAKVQLITEFKTL